MINGKRVCVVLPAYNAARTLHRTVAEVPRDIVDEMILVDDGSRDRTVTSAAELELQVFRHKKNHGYGRNQKTCYLEALRRGADIIVMLHPDYQYSPKLIPSLAGMIASGEYDVALASRILGVGALDGGMPMYKYIANRALTAAENLLLNYKLSEYHTGYRAFSRQTLELLPLADLSDDFVFDNQVLAQAIYFGQRIGEISCPTRYFAEASSINFRRSVTYGVGVLRTSAQFRLQRMGIAKFPMFDRAGRKLRDLNVQGNVNDRYYEWVPSVGGAPDEVPSLSGSQRT